MIYKDHSRLRGKHAMLSPSDGAWADYEPEERRERLQSKRDGYYAKIKGTEDHAFAELCIKRRQKLPRTRQTLNWYVNDAIKYRLVPEIPLYYSDTCFGTADALRYDEKKRLLIIHDLKTGATPAKFRQLELYAALFCFDYEIDPYATDFVLRIYQSDDCIEEVPDSEQIASRMNAIMESVEIIEELEEERYE